MGLAYHLHSMPVVSGWTRPRMKKRAGLAGRISATLSTSHHPLVSCSLKTQPPPDPTMTTTDTLIEDLIQLSDLDLSKRRLEPKSERCKEITLEATGVRKRIPASVLLHYDTRISRGKRGAARMRNTTCGGCNLALPSGQLADMRQEGAELLLCCNCSIYLLPSLPPEVDPDAVVKTTKAAKPAAKVAVKKPRKVKVKAEAAAEPVEETEEEAAPEAEVEATEQEEAVAEVEAPKHDEAVEEVALAN